MAFRYIDHIICFAIKSNSNIHIIKLLGKMGCDADVVSVGELFLARKAGINGDRIVYTGVGKTEKEIRYAIKSNILMFNIESEQELKLIDRIAKDMKCWGSSGKSFIYKKVAKNIYYFRYGYE